MAQSTQRPTSAQVMISRFGSSSPTLGSRLSLQARFGSSVSLSLCRSLLTVSLSLSLSKINKH